ncbi:MAG: TRAP transporter small permease subunit [Syntrophaceae bacterium]|nr:TRAP transporter small permease subunit [Syntrophaceae bacterium]
MKKLYEYICRAEIFMIKVFIVFLVALVFVAATTRYMGYPINWSVDMAVCLFAWCTFLGADVAMRNNKLMNVDFFINKLSPKNKDLIEMVNLFIILIFLVALIGYGAKLSYTTRFRAFQGIPWFSYTWVTISVPIGSMLMVITTILKIREKLLRRRVEFRSQEDR